MKNLEVTDKYQEAFVRLRCMEVIREFFKFSETDPYKDSEGPGDVFSIDHHYECAEQLFQWAMQKEGE